MKTHQELDHYVQSALKFENCKAVSLEDESKMYWITLKVNALKVCQKLTEIFCQQ